MTRHHAPSRRRHRSRGLTALILAALLALTSCAQVDTSLTVEQDGSGTRTFTVHIDQDRLEDLDGGQSAAEQSIRDHLPEGLTFDGVSTEEDRIRAKFTLPFDSVEDYEEKVTALLEASDRAQGNSVEMSITDAPLSQGFSLEESVTSDELFAWLVEGLIVDGVLADDDGTQAFAGQGEVEASFGEQTYETGRSLRIDDVTDHGFDEVIATVIPGDAESYRVEVDYGSAEPISGAHGQAVDAFFEQAVPEGAELTEDPGRTSQERGRRVSGTAEGPDGVQDFLRTALGSEETRFSVEHGTSSEDPTTQQQVVTGTLDCTTVCSSSGYGSGAAELRFVLPAGWEAGGATYGQAEDDGSVVLTSSEEDFRLVAERRIGITDATVRVEVASQDDVSVEFTYRLPTADYETASEALRATVDPQGDGESVQVSSVDDVTALTVTVDGEVSEVNSLLNAALGYADLHVGEPTGFWITQQRMVSATIPQEGLPGGDRMTGDYRVELAPKGGGSIDEDAVLQGSVDGDVVAVDVIREGQATGVSPTVSATVSTISWPGLILLGVLILLGIGLIVAAYLFRGRIARAWSRRDAVTSRMAAAGATAAAGAGAAAASVRSASAGVGSTAAAPSTSDPDRGFTEADLL